MIDIKKVREALERLNNNLDRYMGYYNEHDTHVVDGGELDTNTVKQAITELERLQKKETPMKPIYYTVSGIDKPCCPNCKVSLRVDENNCYDCGQKLSWENDND